jgi:hypothetical protein
MKKRTEIEYTKALSSTGVEVDVPRKVKVPRPPVDTDLLAEKFLFGAAIVAGFVSFGWSVISLAEMFRAVSPAAEWAGYLIGGVGDVVWAGAMVAEYKARYDDEQARLPRGVGWFFLVFTVILQVAHGIATDAWYVGVAAAVVCAGAKMLWVLAMRGSRIRLTVADQILVQKERGSAGVKLAMAETDRQVYRMQARMDAMRASLPAPVENHTVTLDRVDRTMVQTVAHDVVQEPVQEVDQAPDLRMVQAGPVRTASSDQATDQVQILVDRLRSGEKVTKRSAAELLKVSPTTAQRRLSDAKAIVEDGTGQYL